jgi:hypothetical protein
LEGIYKQHLAVVKKEMNDFLTFVSQNKEAITLFFSLAVTISTVVYAILTWRLASETIKMRKAQTEPKISIYLQPCQASFHFFDLVVKNIGAGPAYDVKFKILEEFDVKEGRKLSEMDFIKEGIKYMPPNYSIISFFLGVLGQYNEIIDKNLQIKVIYNNSEKKETFEIIKINMSQFKGRQQLGEDPMNKIAQNIEKIQSDIHQLSSGYHHLLVDTYTAEDREKIRERLEKQRQEIIQKQQKPKENNP